MQTIATSINVQGLEMKGFFHRPDTSSRLVPLIIMFNGYATEWQFGTHEFIKAFTDQGFATLNMDYRYFGQSAGQPRQLLDIPAQLDDCRAMIQHGLKQDWVDAKKVLVWGSSLGGGHAISMAAEHNNLAGMIAQVPHCDSRAAFKTVKLSAVLKGMSNALLDVLGSRLGKAPRYLPVLAEPCDYGVMNHATWLKEYLVLAKDSATWQNRIPARSLLRGADYRPIMAAANIACPCLLVAGEKDQGVPVASVKETAAQIKNAELYLYDGDHFDVYGGINQATIIERQVGFLLQLFKA